MYIVIQILPQFKLGLAVPPEKKVGGSPRERVPSRLDFEGMWAGGAAAGGAGCGTKKTRKRRRRREAKEQREAMQQAQLAGELDGRSRGGRERRAAAAGEDEQPATSSSIA